ncbi:MAG TPA: hypothetical protein VKM55_22110 [Candidatus Lokiarchaeia archaeon]|nr:hypothetical protein [Candidatus Lokiarchaeia archaeon]
MASEIELKTNTILDNSYYYCLTDSASCSYCEQAYPVINRILVEGNQFFICDSCLKRILKQNDRSQQG